MTNIELFEYSGKNPEPILDPDYCDDSDPVIPKTKKGKNPLVENNAKLIELISSFCFYAKRGKKFGDPDVGKLIDEVIDILMKLDTMNLSSFSQFFEVYDSSYAAFRGYAEKEQRRFIYDMLLNYRERRHELYKRHGYTNSMLQVVFDSYSHKRKSMKSIEKIKKILEPDGFVHISNLRDGTRYYFLPDKGDKDAFLAFLKQNNVEFEFAKNKQNKFPDMVIVNAGEYYVVELKHVNGSGGGQDKQVSEIIDFIKYKEQNQHVHYVSYLDGQYSNLLHNEDKRRRKNSKVRKQYENILKWLNENQGYYFLNTAGFKAFVSQLVQD